MICSLGTDMEKGSALCFECCDKLVEALKEGAVLKTYMEDFSEGKEWEEKWQLHGDEFRSDTGSIMSDLKKLVSYLDKYSYEIEIYLDENLIGFVKGI